MKNLFIVLFCMPLLACGILSEQSVYEGIRSQQKIKDVGSEPKSQTLPPYDQYKEERDKQSGK